MLTGALVAAIELPAPCRCCEAALAPVPCAALRAVISIAIALLLDQEIIQ